MKAYEEKLLELGIEDYKRGKITISEMMDVLSNLGIKNKRII